MFPAIAYIGFDYGSIIAQKNGRLIDHATWRRFPSLIESGLKFCKQRLKYGHHNSFFTSKFEMAENRVQVYKTTPWWVFGCFYMFTRFPIVKWYLTRDIMCQTRNIYVISRIFWQQKMVTWHRKPLWLFDQLGLNWDPFCENHLRQRLSWAKRLRFEPVAQPETGLSLRPFMKSAPGASRGCPTMTIHSPQLSPDW